jgi:hypothetical protein
MAGEVLNSYVEGTSCKCMDSVKHILLLIATMDVLCVVLCFVMGLAYPVGFTWYGNILVLQCQANAPG